MLLFCSLQTWRETEMCDQTSVHPLTPFESPPLTDMEMLLAEHIIQTVVPLSAAASVAEFSRCPTALCLSAQAG